MYSALPYLSPEKKFRLLRWTVFRDAVTKEWYVKKGQRIRKLKNLFK